MMQLPPPHPHPTTDITTLNTPSCCGGIAPSTDLRYQTAEALGYSSKEFLQIVLTPADREYARLWAWWIAE